MALIQVAQRAEDLARASAFYADLLGVRPAATYDPPGLVFFDLGGTRLLLDTGAPAGCTTSASTTSTPPSSGCGPRASGSSPSRT